MDLRKIKNSKVIVPRKRTQEIEIHTNFALLNEIDENNKRYEAGQKIDASTQSLYLGIKGDVAKGGCPIYYGYSPIHKTDADNDRYILISWTDKDDHILHFFAFGQESPAYLATEETASGKNFAGISFTHDVPSSFVMENGLYQNHIMGKDETIIDCFQEFDNKIEKKYQIVCVVGRTRTVLFGGNLCLVANDKFEFKIYAADGSIYLSKPGCTTMDKIGEDKAFVEQRIKYHKELLKKYKLDKFNKQTNKFEFDEKTK